jgi:hypothetical protein
MAIVPFHFSQGVRPLRWQLVSTGFLQSQPMEKCSVLLRFSSGE